MCECCHIRVHCNSQIPLAVQQQKQRGQKQLTRQVCVLLLSLSITHSQEQHK